jgi:hypothetical protein
VRGDVRGGSVGDVEGGGSRPWGREGRRVVLGLSSVGTRRKAGSVGAAVWL